MSLSFEIELMITTKLNFIFIVIIKRDWFLYHQTKWVRFLYIYIINKGNEKRGTEPRECSGRTTVILQLIFTKYSRLLSGEENNLNSTSSLRQETVKCFQINAVNVFLKEMSCTLSLLVMMKWPSSCFTLYFSGITARKTCTPSRISYSPPGDWHLGITISWYKAT